MIAKNENGFYQADIDGHVYEFEKWGADDATDTILDIAAITGKPMALGAAAVFGKNSDGEKNLDQKFDPNMIAIVMESLTQQVGANKAIIKALIKKLSSDKVMCDGKKVNFNLHYQDRLDHLFKVVKSGVEVQFGNFFAALFAGGGFNPQAMMSMINRGPQASNGPSGGQ